jgi:hypothetical protein
MIVSPLLLELGVHPLVAASTSSLMVRPFQYSATGWRAVTVTGHRLHHQPDVPSNTALQDIVQALLPQTELCDCLGGLPPSDAVAAAVLTASPQLPAQLRRGSQRRVDMTIVMLGAGRCSSRRPPQRWRSPSTTC